MYINDNYYYKISFYINDSKLIGIMSIKKEVGKGNTFFILLTIVLLKTGLGEC